MLAGRPQAYLLTPKGVLQEVNRFKQQHSAWLTADKLMAGGYLGENTMRSPCTRVHSRLLG